MILIFVCILQPFKGHSCTHAKSELTLLFREAAGWIFWPAGPACGNSPTELITAAPKPSSKTPLEKHFRVRFRPGRGVSLNPEERRPARVGFGAGGRAALRLPRPPSAGMAPADGGGHRPGTAVVRAAGGAGLPPSPRRAPLPPTASALAITNKSRFLIPVYKQSRF